MKKLIIIPLLLVLMFIGEVSFAQGFGLKGSFNFFNLSQKDGSGNTIENKMIPVLDAGLFYEIPVAPEFCIRPELLYTLKGAKMDKIVDTKTHLSYVELPVLLLYKGALSDGYVLLGFGPYLSMGVSGTIKTSNLNYDIKFKNDITAVESLTGAFFRPLDFGGKIMVGYEFGIGLSAAINASYGMSNINPKIAGDKPEATTRNVGFGLTLGYRFGKN
jgi:hypothetical protein